MSLLTQHSLLKTRIESPVALRVVSVACGLIPNGFFNHLGRRRYYANPHSTNDLYIVECIKRLHACLLKSTTIRCVASWATIHPLHSPRSLQQTPHFLYTTPSLFTILSLVLPPNFLVERDTLSLYNLQYTTHSWNGDWHSTSSAPGG